MMTLDEAIKHAAEVVQEKQYENQECIAVHDMKNAMDCAKCAEEHKQLAEWLKELKRLREQKPCEDAVSRQAVFEEIDDCSSDGLKGIFCSYDDAKRFKEYIKELPPVTPITVTDFADRCRECGARYGKLLNQKTRHCKDCKWWKDSDGIYRRGCGAESQCPINRREVLEGNGYCFLFEPQEEVISDTNMKMWEEIFEAESEG